MKFQIQIPYGMVFTLDWKSKYVNLFLSILSTLGFPSKKPVFLNADCQGNLLNTTSQRSADVMILHVWFKKNSRTGCGMSVRPQYQNVCCEYLS